MGTLFKRRLQRPPMGKGGRRILPLADWKERTAIREGREAQKEEENRENTAWDGGEQKNLDDIEILQQ